MADGAGPGGERVISFGDGRKNPAKYGPWCMLLWLVLLWLVVSPVHGAAGSPPPGSPGPRPAPAQSPGVEALVRRLYGARADGPIVFHRPECGRAPCAVRVLAEEAWSSAASGAHRLVVTAAEPRDASGHASQAVLGIGLFRRERGSWVMQAGSPRVDVAGGYGVAPEVEIIEAGRFGRGVVATPGYTAQGITQEWWRLYVNVAGHFRQVLDLLVTSDHSGRCQPPESRPPDPGCDAESFSSDVRVTVAKDGGLDVAQTKTGAASRGHPRDTRRWHISPSGRVSAR